MQDTVFIIGSGPSTADIDLSRLAYQHTICINCAILDVPNPNYFITKDYTFLTKLKHGMYNGRTEFPQGSYVKAFVVGLHDGTITTDGIYFYHKSNPREHFKLQEMDQVIISKAQAGLGKTWGDFRCGGDSGYPALQMAYLLGYKNIYLVGYDFAVRRNKTHGHSYYGNRNAILMDKKLKKWSTLYKGPFKQMKEEGVNVVSLSPISRLNNYIPFEHSEKVLKCCI